MNILLNGSISDIINDKIECITLFGSYARHDNDDYSDLDILVIVDDCNDDTYINLKKEFCECLNIPANWLSVYRKSKIENMRVYGSYFLWHLKLEGHIIYEKTGFLSDTLLNLKNYSRTREDLLEYLIICNDIENSIKIDSSTLIYELSILASLIRNTCMALCHSYGKFVFSRVEPVLICLNLLRYKLDFDIDEYKLLYMYRIAYSRDITLVTSIKPDIDYAKFWVSQVRKLIEITLDMQENIEKGDDLYE